MTERVSDDGSTRRDHLLSAQRQGVFVPELEEGIALALELQYLWGWFLELHSCRGNNGFGVLPLTFEGIKAWREETNIPPLLPYEREVIQAWDSLFMKSRADQEKAEVNRRKAQS